MMHLPGLVLSDQINQVIHSANRIGLAVRGIYGEGTEALAHLFQVSQPEHPGRTRDAKSSPASKKSSNKSSRRNTTPAKNCSRPIRHQTPRSPRPRLRRAPPRLHDRDQGSPEPSFHAPPRPGPRAAQSRATDCSIDHLLVEIQPAHLQLAAKRKLSPEERDALRAELLRLHLRNLPEPEATLPPPPPARSTPVRHSPAGRRRNTP